MQNETQNALSSPDGFEQGVIMERIFVPHARRRRDAIYPPGTEHWQRFIHYTSAEAAIKIINQKRLWLRNATCMSDYGEVQHGFSILQRFFSNPEKAKSFTDAIDAFAPGAAREAMAEFNSSWTSGTFQFNTFIGSVSEHDPEEDVHGRLSMWRAFGGNTARVGLVLRVPYRSPGGEAMNLIFSPVAYFKDDEADQWLAQVIKNVHANQTYLQTTSRPVLTNWISYMLLLGVTCVKHEGFREEKEWRIVHCPHLHSSPLITPTTVVVGGVPQIVFNLPLDRSVSPIIEDLEFSNLFDRLIIGPSPYPAPMFAAFADILTKAGVADAAKKIYISYIPIRS